MLNNSTYTVRLNLAIPNSSAQGHSQPAKVYTAVTGSPKLMNRLGSWTLLLKQSCQYDIAESTPHVVRV